MTHHERPAMSSQMTILLRRLRMSFAGSTMSGGTGEIKLRFN
jgi:hypothetical protein